MNKLNTYYHIVPTKDGFTYLCQNANTDELYLWRKASDTNPEALVFFSECAAEEWIKFMDLSPEHFKSEWFATAEVIEKFSDIKQDILAELGYSFEVGV